MESKNKTKQHIHTQTEFIDTENILVVVGGGECGVGNMDKGGQMVQTSKNKVSPGNNV